MGEILAGEISEVESVKTEKRIEILQSLLTFYYLEDRAEVFDRYYQMLCEWNTRMNLTGSTDFHTILYRHFSDCLSPLKEKELFPANAKVIDVGSGAGFPGIPLAIARSDLQVTLLDSLQKRVNFLNAVKEQLGLNNVEVKWGRAEEAARDSSLRESFDIATARAVAPCNILCELLLPFVCTGGKMVCYKGPAAEQELVPAKRSAFLLGGGVPFLKAIEVSGTEQMSHYMLICTKQRSTPAMYPRRAGIPQKKPLGV